MGYSITGNQDEQAFWFNHGAGSNGKTTLMGVIIDVLGDYASEIDTQAFVLDKQSTTGPNEALASLYNKRFTAATEVKTTMSLDVALIKRMTGGEQIRCERKYEHGYNFKPTHKLWLSGNHEPRIFDTTNSIWNRLKYIPFNVKIEDTQRIKGLRNILSRDHAPAILAWLVKGCLLWQRDGLDEPTEVKDAIQTYRDNEDLLHDFIDEVCLIKTSEKILVAELYKAYAKWAEDNDIKPVGKKTFNNLMTEKEFKSERGNYNKMIWGGIRLRIVDDDVTNVTNVTAIPETFPKESRVGKSSGKIGNKSNKSNTYNKSNFFCPSCQGTESWQRIASSLGPAAQLCSRCHPEPAKYTHGKPPDANPGALKDE